MTSIKLIEVNNENRTRYTVFMFNAEKIVATHGITECSLRIESSEVKRIFMLEKNENTYDQLEWISNGTLFNKPMTIIIRNKQIKWFDGYEDTRRAIAEVSLVGEKIKVTVNEVKVNA